MEESAARWSLARREWIILLVIATVFVLAVSCGFYQAWATDQKDFLCAAFFTLQTITTTGYGTGFNLNDSIKILSCFLMLVGSTLWAVLIGIIVNVLSDRWKDKNSHDTPV